MFLKKLLTKQHKQKEIVQPPIEYKNAMAYIERILNEKMKDEDKIVILDFVSEMVKKDLQSNVITTIFYSEDHFKKNLTRLLPPLYFDENNVEHYFQPEDASNYSKNIDLSTDCVLVMPWNKDRLPKNILNIFKNGFIHHPSNHMAYYYTELDICYVYNGTHSITSGIGYKNGLITAEVFQMNRIFEHIRTDGLHWYSTHNNIQLGEVYDFRVAIIYEIAKIKYNLLKQPN